MDFYIKLGLPLLKKEIHYKSLTNYHYINVLKYITNNDDAGLCEYFDFVLSDCILEKEIIKNLSNIEKFLILLDLRSIAIGDELQLQGEKSATLKYSINSIKNNVLQCLPSVGVNNVFKYDAITVELSPLRALMINDIDDLYIGVINKVELLGECVIFDDITLENKKNIEKMLPAKFSEDILTYINDVKSKLAGNVILNGKESFGIPTIPLEIFDNTLFHFIRSIFSDNLINMYELEYTITSKFGISYERFIKMTPVECKIFINFYNRDKKREEEEQNKANKGSQPSFGGKSI